MVEIWSARGSLFGVTQGHPGEKNIAADPVSQRHCNGRRLDMERRVTSEVADSHLLPALVARRQQSRDPQESDHHPNGRACVVFITRGHLAAVQPAAHRIKSGGQPVLGAGPLNSSTHAQARRASGGS